MEMHATDLDDPNAGQNAVLTYSIIQNVRNRINLDLFSINAATGTIYTVLRSLDREEEQRHLLVVEARDGEGLAGTGTATIMVSDVNDHPPVFTQRLYSAQVGPEPPPLPPPTPRCSPALWSSGERGPGGEQRGSGGFSHR